MSETPQTRTPLSRIPVGAHARIVQIVGGHKLALRLLGLGLRVGSEVQVLHHRGGGLVVSHGETRVALGGGIVEKLWVEPLPASARPSQ
jgi:ferrous iron transport protein A